MSEEQKPYNIFDEKMKRTDLHRKRILDKQTEIINNEIKSLEKKIEDLKTEKYYLEMYYFIKRNGDNNRDVEMVIITNF